ncbi:retrovirus-related Pol polyprotein from transposon 412 [Nephila pilipes]|uniref:Retrovirus-related Pol polyprotein from transposon 412 n=1 Tax=Nephila pilipes TaxID=299642 RepID=A0A8X6P956_NEPPI|nr:retrovirus-related Pol polyprotein from transposon 412 [Nephila pilipes]
MIMELKSFSLLSLKGRSSFLQLEPKPSQSSDSDLLCDIATGSPRPFIPKSFRRLIFKQLHKVSHPGIAATRKLNCARYIWPIMKRKIKNGSDAVNRTKDLKFSATHKLH